MLSEKQLQHWLGRILQVGIILAILLVFIGGIRFLWAHGNEPMHDNIFLATNFDIDIFKIWHQHLLTTPIGMIELGLLTLVVTQVTRIAVIAYYYVITYDKWFMAFSFFILSVILYSLLWQ